MGKFIGKLDREQRRLAISCAIGLVVGVATYFATDTIKSGKDYIEWNGGIYRGDISNGIPNGNGKLEKDGMTYTGFWENGEMASGHIESDKYVYEGELKGTKFNGYGVCRYKAGHTYRGYWADDYKDGLGLLTGADGQFTFGFYKAGLAQVPKGASYKVGDKVYGIDVSRHQGVIDWQDLYLSCDKHGTVSGKLDKSPKYLQPVFFAIAKSTQGTKLRDSRFESNYTEAKRCGMVCGAYHFLTMNATGKAQAEHFIKNTTLESGDLPPVLDLEKNSADGHISDKAFSAIIPIAKEWLAAVEKHYAAKPIIYTNMNVYTKFIATDPILSKYDLWIADIGKERPNASNCIIWQFSHNGEINGITQNNVDLNLFYGNHASLVKYVKDKGIK